MKECVAMRSGLEKEEVPTPRTRGIEDMSQKNCRITMDSNYYVPSIPPILKCEPPWILHCPCFTTDSVCVEHILVFLLYKSFLPKKLCLRNNIQEATH